VQQQSYDYDLESEAADEEAAGDQQLMEIDGLVSSPSVWQVVTRQC
jgi:hypothetical protein